MSYANYIKTFVLALFAAGCGSEIPPSTSSSVEATAPDGRTIFRKHCVTCHGIDGKLGLNGAKDLTVTTMKDEEKQLQIKVGKGAMNPFKDILSEAEIEAVVQFTNTLKSTK